MNKFKNSFERFINQMGKVILHLLSSLNIN